MALHPFFKSNDFKKLKSNFLNYSFIQITNYLMPLIIIPYLVRIIGPEKYGIITFVQSIMVFLMVVVDYGFLISGVSSIAKLKLDKEKISELFSVIFYIRVLLMTFVGILLFVAYYFLEDISTYPLIYLFSFVIIPGNILLSSWFYIGIEKASYLNGINFFLRVLYIISIFLFITKPADFYLVPALNSFSFILAGFISFGIILTKFKIKLFVPSMSLLKKQIYKGWDVFIANLSMNLYRNANIVILGLVSSKEIVGIYAAGEKLIKAMQSLFNPITNAFFPFISRLKSENPKRSIKAIKGLMIFLGITTCIISMSILISSDTITRIVLGIEFLKASNVIKIASFVIFISFFNYVLGIIYMINFNLEAQFRKSVLITGVLNIIICYLSSYYFMELGTAFSLLLAELILLICIIFYINKYRKIRNK